MDHECDLPPASASIFSGTTSHSTTIGPHRALARSKPTPTAAASLRTAAAIDAELIAILDTPLLLDETALVGYARKEAAMLQILASLTVAESRALHARLVVAKPGDPLVDKLARFTTERRTRLIHFLADARRREAIAAARRTQR